MSELCFQAKLGHKVLEQDMTLSAAVRKKREQFLPISKCLQVNSQGGVELEDTPTIPKLSIILTEKDTTIGLCGLIKGRDVSTRNKT